MDHDLETIRYHLSRLITANGDSEESNAELLDAFEHLDARLERIEAALAELQRPTDLAAETTERQATVQRSCSWCDTLNGTDVQHCRQCGHEAHQPRMLCGCSRCRPTTTTTR